MFETNYETICRGYVSNVRLRMFLRVFSLMNFMKPSTRNRSGSDDSVTCFKLKTPQYLVSNYTRLAETNFSLISLNLRPIFFRIKVSSFHLKRFAIYGVAN